MLAFESLYYGHIEACMVDIQKPIGWILESLYDEHSEACMVHLASTLVKLPPTTLLRGRAFSNMTTKSIRWSGVNGLCSGSIILPFSAKPRLLTCDR